MTTGAPRAPTTVEVETMMMGNDDRSSAPKTWSMLGLACAAQPNRRTPSPASDGPTVARRVPRPSCHPTPRPASLGLRTYANWKMVPSWKSMVRDQTSEGDCIRTMDAAP